MSGFFDFLGLANRKYNERYINRLNVRHRFIIDPYRGDILGARVLDLGAHDGRWAYAFAAAGAEEVIGVEGRPELVAQYASFPAEPFKQRVHLRCMEIFEYLRMAVAQREKFDVIGVLGIYYHITDNYGLLALLRELEPKLVIIDSDFMTLPWPCIALVFEDTADQHATLPYFAGQKIAPVSVPSQVAMERMAETLGYRVQWADWSTVPEGERLSLDDYYNQRSNKQRFTCCLRPTASARRN